MNNLFQEITKYFCTLDKPFAASCFALGMPHAPGRCVGAGAAAGEPYCATKTHKTHAGAGANPSQPPRGIFCPSPAGQAYAAGRALASLRRAATVLLQAWERTTPRSPSVPAAFRPAESSHGSSSRCLPQQPHLRCFSLPVGAFQQ